ALVHYPQDARAGIGVRRLDPQVAAARRPGLGPWRHSRADLFRLDDGKDGPGVFAVVVQADPAHLHRRQAPGQLLERLAAVGGLVDARPGTPLPGRVVPVIAFGLRRFGSIGVEAVALAVVGGDQQGVGIPWVHAHVDDAGLIVHVKDLGPALAAVGGLVEAALRVRSVEPAQGP